jgi:hypothetical protein
MADSKKYGNPLEYQVCGQLLTTLYLNIHSVNFPSPGWQVLAVLSKMVDMSQCRLSRSEVTY